MNIAISTETSIPNGVGDTVRIMQMARSLHRAGHEIHILSYNVNGSASGFHLHQTDLRKFINEYRAMVKLNKIDVFLTNSLNHANIALQNSIVPVVYDIHDPIVPMLNCSKILGIDTLMSVTKARISKIERYVVANANFVTCASPRVKQFIIEQGVPPDKVETILNGVPHNYLNVKKECIYGDFPVIVHQGNLSGLFDYNTILKASLHLLQYQKNIRFVFMGKGPLRKYLQLFSLFSNDRVIMEEWLSSTDFPKHLAAGDIGIHAVGVHAHGYYACHMKTFDYMGLGLPVVGTDSDYGTEIVKKAKAGVIVPPDNWKEFAEAIIFLIENPQVAKKLGQNGRIYARNNLTWESQLQGLEKILRNLKIMPRYDVPI